MAKVFKIFYTDNKDNFDQKIVISASKRAVTKQYESLDYEILKYIDVTDKYTFTIDEVLEGKLSEEQKKLLAYILEENGVPYTNNK